MIQFNNIGLQGMLGTFGSSCTFFIYSGTMPTVDANFLWVASNYSAQLLGQQASTLKISGNKITLLSTSGQTVPNTNTGTATWFACVPGSNSSSAIIGPVSSDPATTGPMLMDSVNFVQNATPLNTIVDFGINFN